MHTYRLILPISAALTIGCGSLVNVAEDNQGGGGSGGLAAGGTITTAQGAGGNNGGQGGVAGQGGNDMGGSGSIAPWCTDASECTILSDCCECSGKHVTENLDGCPLTCPQASCEAMSAPPNAECVAGRCVVGFECTGVVICLLPEPDCEPGEVPRIVGNCYQGCVPVGECASTPSCDDCGTGDVCVVETDELPSKGKHCVPVPTACGDQANCACAGHLVCGADETCTDQPNGELHCTPN